MLKDINCPHCQSFTNVVIDLDFKNKVIHNAYCIKRKIKPHLVRKFGKVINSGCGKTFKLSLKLKESIMEEDSQLCQKL